MCRLLLVVLATAAAACFGNASELAALGDDSVDQAPPQDLASCVTNEDCQLVGASCCECPTFATSLSDPRLQACEAVNCDTDALVCPTNVTAACNTQNQCELACAPLECLQCENGYFLEANGCLSCTCLAAPTTSPSCVADTDCERTRADCCGCGQGGDDTAVALADLAAFDTALACPPSPQCPGQANANEPTCNTAEFTPRCALGECALLREPMPANACGRPDLPACPAGTTCKINVNDSANLYGVGVCAP